MKIVYNLRFYVFFTVLFASLFSLMLFLQDQERGIYIALSGKRRYGILCTGLLA